MQTTPNAGVVSSNPALVTIKTPLVGKATGNHLTKSKFMGKTQSSISGFCCARNRACNSESR